MTLRLSGCNAKLPFFLVLKVLRCAYKSFINKMISWERRKPKRALFLLLLTACSTGGVFHRPLTKGWHKVNVPIPGLWGKSRDVHIVDSARNRTFCTRSRSIAVAFRVFRGGALEVRSTEALAEEILTKNNTTRPEVSASLPNWKRNLPAPLCDKGPKTLQRLRLGTSIIYLLGTAHVSNDSSAETALLLGAVDPDCIVVELCDARVPLLEGGSEKEQNETNKSFWEKVKLNQETTNSTRLQSICTLLLTSVQQDYADDLGVELGGEFRCAHQYWLGKKNCHLILGDRPLSLTLVRAWESLSFFGRTKVMLGLLWSSFRKPNPEELREWLRSVLRDETDVLTESFVELRRHFPTLYTTIIEERDAWLAAKIVQTVRALQNARRESTIVAIVGAGHMPGILQWLTAPPKNATTPEEILKPLTLTKKWANDEVVQKDYAPAWIHEVTELNREDK